MQGKHKSIIRGLRADLAILAEKRHSAFILGPRQVGKTSLIRELLEGKKDVIQYPLHVPGIRQEFEKDPGSLITRIKGLARKPTVFIDEVQKVPELMDAVQYLIDEKLASFILTGSSARKLRRSGANLLPGRVKSFRMDALTWPECGWNADNRVPELAAARNPEMPAYGFQESLIYGMLPGIVSQGNNHDRAEYLVSYAQTYLEEEIRAEALVRNVPAFSRFLQLAAMESGTAPNMAKLSMESGVSLPSIKTFYDILVDTLIAERVEPYMKNTRKRVLASSRYFIFDLGVRNALAHLPLVPESAAAIIGPLFEHAVILEIIHRIRMLRQNHKVCYWRTSGGAEVDCVIDTGANAIPIEIKATKRPRLGELKGLRNFLEEHRKTAKQGYVVTMGSEPERLADNILAIPWSHL